MGASLFKTNQTPTQNNLLNQVSQLKNMLSGANPTVVAERMIANNPQFAQFVGKCKNKSVEEICKDYGLDYNQVKQLLK